MEEIWRTGERTMNKNRTLAIFGDSIMKGVQVQRDTKRYCVEDFLAAGSLEQRFGISLRNCSRFGYTITRGEEYLVRQMEKGLDADFVVLEYGGNDADFRWDEVAADPAGDHEPNTPLSAFLKTLNSMIDRVRANGRKPVLTTLPPISAERYLNWITRSGLSKERILEWLGDEGAIYRYQERYSNGIKMTAEKKKVDLIDLRDAFLAQRQLLPYLCIDGIHPNTEGQRLIREAFSKELLLLTADGVC